jgi:hypothetical protein
MELLIGTGSRPSNFSDADDMARAWRDHGADILAARSPGQRARAFWLFDAPEPRDRRVSEAVQLLRLGLLSDYERRALASDWMRSELVARRHARDAPAGKVSRGERERIYRSLRDLHGVPPEIAGDVDDPIDE